MSHLLHLPAFGGWWVLISIPERIIWLAAVSASVTNFKREAWASMRWKLAEIITQMEFFTPHWHGLHLDYMSHFILEDTLSNWQALWYFQESTLKSILSALWNLSAHSVDNKLAICSVDGALDFLVSTLTYRCQTNSLAIIESGGGILRNVSSLVATREDYRLVPKSLNMIFYSFWVFLVEWSKFRYGQNWLKNLSDRQIQKEFMQYVLKWAKIHKGSSIQ